MKRIRTRLIVAFLLVAMLPAVPLSLVVRNLLERSFGPAVDVTLEEGLTAGLAQSRDALRAHKQTFLATVTESWLPRLMTGPAADLGPIVVLDAAGNPLPPAEVPPALRQWLDQATPASGSPRTDDVARVDTFLAVALAVTDRRVVGIAQPLPPEMVTRAGRLTSALGLVRALRQDRERILRSYIAPFLVVYGILILAAVAAGVLLARRIARPLEQLVHGTKQVAAGDLTTTVQTRASGEVATLVAAFNTMVARLAQQRRQLARLERVAAWRDLARTLAHEIKNPLTPILLAVQSVKDGYRGSDPEHAALLAECEQIVKEEVEGLRSLVREFSEFARLPEPRPARGDLNDLLQDLVRLYGEEKIVCETPAVDMPAWFDAAELRRALINLVENGLAACTEAGRPARVFLAVQCGEQEILLAVRDAGGGIAPENLARIFEPNFSTKTEGMGLGLCIVESIVAGHGGSVAVTSEPDIGTTFTLRLPQALPPRPAASSSPVAGVSR